MGWGDAVKDARQIVCWVALLVAAIGGACPWWVPVIAAGCCGWVTLLAVGGDPKL